MRFYKNKGFSLIEIMAVIGIVSLVLAISAPILTKRMKSSHTSGCVGGSKSVKKIFLNDSEFTVPENILGDISIIMIGGGGAGGDGSDEYEYTNANSANCSLGALSEGKFYENVLLSAVKAGEEGDCESGNSGGRSGAFILNYKIRTGRCPYTYSVNNEILTPDTQGCPAINLPAFQEGNPGEVGNIESPDYLLGGYPPTPFSVGMGINRFRGVGGNCFYNSHNNAYNRDLNRGPTDGACKISYRTAQAGAGGGAGAYASFAASLPSGTQCNITIGQGGGAIGAGGAVLNGGNTSITCVVNNVQTSFSVGGGSNASGTTAGAGGSFYENIPAAVFQGGAGSAPSADEISGGSGGSSMKSDEVYSEGARGGCIGAFKSSDCSNPNGENAVSPRSDLKSAGAGGGGGSCNDNGCGKGGFGADGIVIFEYRTKCY